MTDLFDRYLVPPRVYAADALGALPEATLAKVPHDNAARVCHLH